MNDLGGVSKSYYRVTVYASEPNIGMLSPLSSVGLTLDEAMRDLKARYGYATARERSLLTPGSGTWNYNEYSQAEVNRIMQRLADVTSRAD